MIDANEGLNLFKGIPEALHLFYWVFSPLLDKVTAFILVRLGFCFAALGVFCFGGLFQAMWKCMVEELVLRWLALRDVFWCEELGGVSV